MRVLWLTENHPPSRGGMAQSCDRIVRGLRANGVDVDVAHLSRAAGRWRTERVERGRTITAPIEDDHEHALRRLWTDVERLHDDVRYTHVAAFGGTLPLLSAPTFAAWLETPLVTLLRGNDFDTGVFSLRRRAFVVDALRASATITVVASNHAPLAQRLAPRADVRWIPNGIDLTDWELLPSEQAAADEWRREHVEDGRTTIGLIGQLKRKKGSTFLLDAVDAAGRAADIHVILVGDTDERTDHWLSEHEGDLGVTRLPFLDRFELVRWYAACDFVAVPSFYDGLPNVALEANALGVPLIASDAGGLADLLRDGTTGILFPAGDAAACRAAVDRALRLRPDDRRDLGVQARERVAKELHATREAEAYVALLRDLDAAG